MPGIPTWSMLGGVLITATAVVACSGSCSSGSAPPSASRDLFPSEQWTVESEDPHPLLKSECRLVTWKSRSPREPEDCATRIRCGERVLRVGSPSDLRDHIRGLASPADAVGYSELLRKLDLEQNQVPGEALQASGSDRWGLGFYSRADAQKWGIGDAPAAETAGDGYVVRRAVVVHPGAGIAGIPEADFAVVLIREFITREGGYRYEIERILQRQDAHRYAFHRL
jgi:hypothetical protein